MKEGSCENSQLTTVMVRLIGVHESIAIEDKKKFFLSYAKKLSESIKTEKYWYSYILKMLF